MGHMGKLSDRFSAAFQELNTLHFFFFAVYQILVLIITLPLNVIPFVGQMAFATINGWVLTFGIRFHYDAEIRNISVLQSRREAWKRKRDYTG